MKSLKERLEKKGLRPSYHRLKILEYLETHFNHPTVDMIYGALSKDVPTISKTTVYNTLGALSENGLIKELTISGQESRYEGHLHPHSHFLCKACGKVLDINNVRIPKVNEAEGCRVEEIHLYLKGLCKECAKKGGVNDD